MNKKEKLAFAFVAALAMTSGGFAFGQSVNNVSSDQVIYACVTGVNGNITKVSNTPKTCPRGTTPISWNMVGPKGDQGIQGLQGIQGERGLSGTDGSTGAKGEDGSVVYLVSPDGKTKYKVVNNFIDGRPLVEIDGYFWQYRSGEFTPSYDRYGTTFALFTSDNCLGQQYIYTSQEQYLPLMPQVAESIFRSPNGYDIWDVTSNRVDAKAGYTITQSTKTLAEVKSLHFVGDPEQAGIDCLNLNLGDISSKFDNFIKQAATFVESEKELKSGEASVSFEYKYLDCKATRVAELTNGWGYRKDYIAPNCEPTTNPVVRYAIQTILYQSPYVDSAWGNVMDPEGQLLGITKLTTPPALKGWSLVFGAN